MRDQTKSQGPPAPLQLTVPAQDVIESPNVETDPSRLVEWINHLPYANPPSVAAALYESIYQFNRFPGTVNHRYELVNCYQPPFDVVYQAARQATQQKGTQNRLKKNDIIPIAIKITVELAYSYKFIINEHLQLNNIRKHQQPFGHAIYSAMKAIMLELMLEYSNLMPDSKKAWRELFQLYSLAEQYNLEQTPIEEGISINLLFKRILLIAIIDPYRLLKGEVWFCYNYLTHWAVKSELHRSTTVPDNITGLFLVDLQAMQPPKPPEPNATLHPEHHRLLHVNSLNLMIHQQRKRLLADKSSEIKGVENISKEQASQMFRHMLLAWHVRPTRRSERHEKYGACPVTYGLSAINHFLKRGKLTQESAHTETLVEEDTLTLGETAPFCREEKQFQIYSWRIFNKSRSGIGIIVPPPFPKEVQVGQLIMIELDADGGEKELKTGIIRRMIERDSNTLEIGIQFLPGKTVPISIRPHFYDRELTADFQHGILVDRGAKTPQALITPQGMYRQQRELVLDNNGFIQRIISDEMIETTPIFDCFDYHEIEISKE